MKTYSWKECWQLVEELEGSLERQPIVICLNRKVDRQRYILVSIKPWSYFLSLFFLLFSVSLSVDQCNN